MLRKNKSFLKTTTALVGSALIGTSIIFSASSAIAGTTTINTDTTNTGTVTDQLDLTSGASYINNGLINTGSSGITITNGGSISNNSVLIATQSGIKTNDSGTLSESIINNDSALISAGETGISINNGTISGYISNYGSIIGQNSYGINVSEASSVSSGIANQESGLIFGGSTGIHIDGTVSGGIDNRGSIFGGEVGINVNTDYLNNISNDDNLAVISGGNTGILISSGSSISRNIYNTGSIIGITVGIDIQADGAVKQGIQNISGGLISGGIINSGSILGGEGGEGILVATSSMVSGGIINNTGGLISGNNSGIAVSSSTISGAISNSGSIIGDTYGIKAINAQIGSINNTIGLISGDIAIKLNNSTVSGSITNGGSIIGGGDVNSKVGIQGSVGMLGGSIINQSNALIYGGDAIQLASYTMSGGITNSGSIIGNFASGIYSANSIITNGITNEEGAIIYGEAFGIYQYNSNQSGGIVNSGTIIGNTNTGILIQNSSILSGGITNNANALVSAGISGIAVYTNSIINGSISNSGTIINNVTSATSGILSGGIITSDSTLNGDIINASGALIEGAGTGLLVTRTTLNGSINNSGIINARGLSFSGSSTGIYGTGLYLNRSFLSGSISNSGTIEGSLYGMIINVNNTISGGITNSASALIQGSVTGIAINSGSTINSDISNSGSIIGYGTGSKGISLNTASSGSIYNTAGGLISAANTGLLISNSTISGGISNSGSIIGQLADGINLKNSFVTGGIANFSGGLIAGSDTGGIVLSNSTISGGISNSGTIKSDSYIGIYNGENSIIYGGITNEGGVILSGIINDGSIFGNADNIAIRVGDNSLIEGGIQNRSGAIISGSSIGINMHAATLSGGITNRGSIIGGGDVSRGIYIANSVITDNGILNTANALISGASTGINISNSIISGGILNNGTVIGESHGINVGMNGIVNGGINNSSGLISGGISNSGSIFGAVSGISIGSGGDIGNDLTNNASALISGGNTAISLVSVGRINGAVINNGTIIGHNTYAINLNRGGTISDTLTNNASSVIYGGSTAINIYSGGDISAGISNSGSIVGHNKIGINIYDSGKLTGGISNTTNGIIYGGDTGIKIENPSTIGDITNSGTISGGTYAIHMSNLDNGLLNIIISGDNAHVIGDVYDASYVNGDSIATIYGNFTTQGNWQVSDLTVDSGKTLTISHNNTITLSHMSASEGTLNFAALGTEDHSTLNVTNSNINLTGATVTIHSLNSADITDGEAIKIGTGTSSVTGIIGKQHVTDDTFLWDFKIGDGSNVDGGNSDQLYVFVTKNNFGSSNSEVADTIASLDDSENPIIKKVLSNLTNASAPEQVKILESLNPTTDGNSFVASQNIAGSVTNLTDTRLASLRDGDPSSGIATGDSANNKNVWAQAFGKMATQGIRGGISGYDANTQGVAFGIDRGVANDIADIGIAFGMSKSDMSSRNLNTTSTNVDSYQISFYSDYRIDDRTFIDSNVSYVSGNSTSVKHNVGGTGEYAQGDYGSQQVTAQAELGRNFQLGLTKVTLSTLAHYVRYSEDKYTETGSAGPLLLTVNNKDMQQFEMGVGADFSWDVNIGNGYILRPSTNIGYRHDFFNDGFTSTATFTGGGTFTTNGLNPANDTFDAGAALKLINANSWDISIDYDYEHMQDYKAHTGMLKYGYKF